MALSAKLRRAPMRIATGAYILNSGVTKLQTDDETAKALHGTATGTYEFLGKMDPKTFSRVLGAGEITVGALLLAPVVPPVVAGAALMGFSGLLLNMWWNTPGMHEEGSPRPTHQGAPVAKDVWMFGIGTGLVLDGLLEPAHDKRLELTAAAGERANLKRKQARQARKAAKAAAKRSRRSAKAKQAQGATQGAADRLAGLRDEYGPVAAEKARQARDRAKALADEYGPVAAEKAQLARDRAKALADEYGPVAAEKARQARAAAQDLAEEYGPVAAEKARQAQAAARDAAERARAVVR
jgi:uncharacterized membrane protein YphA (DoxX/SURF4 family)